jgi:hypothetical protein
MFPGNSRQFTLEIISTSHPLIWPNWGTHIYPGPLLPSTDSFIYSDDPAIAEREREYERFRDAYTDDLVATIGLEPINLVYQLLEEYAQVTPNFWLVSEHLFYATIRQWIYGSRSPRPVPNALWYRDHPHNHRREARIMASMPSIDPRDPATSLVDLETFENRFGALSNREL